jgi:hypothetical protein
MDMLEIFIIAALGFLLGWEASKRVHLQGFRQLLRALGITEQQLRSAMVKIQSSEWQLDEEEGSQDPTVVEVRLEQVGTEIYAYRKDNDQFLGQGGNPQGLIERLNQNLTPCRVIVAQEDGAHLLQ